MFDSLTERLQGVMQSLKGHGKLTAEDIDAAMREIRLALLEAMKLDKKVSAGEVKFVLARRLGSVEFGCRVPSALLEEIITSLAGPRNSLT